MSRYDNFAIPGYDKGFTDYGINTFLISRASESRLTTVSLGG